MRRRAAAPPAMRKTRDRSEFDVASPLSPGRNTYVHAHVSARHIAVRSLKFMRTRAKTNRVFVIEICRRPTHYDFCNFANSACRQQAFPPRARFTRRSHRLHTARPIDGVGGQTAGLVSQPTSRVDRRVPPVPDAALALAC